MYIVQWCDHEGNLQERQIERLEDASLEALKLRRLFDGVEVLDAETGKPVEL